jgi:transketolase
MEAAGRVRSLIRRMILASGGGHAGGSLSMAEILAVLYFGLMNHDPARPDWPERDRLVLSKGHGSLALYAALALAGYFPMEDLDRFAAEGSALMNHPDGHRIPGVEVSTGSLGHGLPIAVGIALAARLRGEKHRTYCVLGDGECHEGLIWEAAMSAAQWRLGRLTVLVDRNRIGNDGPVDRIVNLEPFVDKWRSFGWDVEAVDGHDVEALERALTSRCGSPADGAPKALVAETVKGRGLAARLEGTGASHYLKGDRCDLEEAFPVETHR